MGYTFNFWNCINKAMDAFIICYLPFRLLKMRSDGKYRTAVFAGALTLIAGILYGSDLLLFRPPLIITLGVFVSTALLYCCSLYRGSFCIKVILAGAAISTVILLRYFTGTLLNALSLNVELWSLEMTLFTAVPIMALLAFLIHFAYIPQAEPPLRSGAGMAVYMLLMVLATDIVTSAGLSISKPQMQIGVLSFSLGSILFLYQQHFRSLREFEENAMLRLILRTREAQQKNLQESVQIYQEMRMLRHEMKNHVFYMEMLLNQSRFEELSAYFRSVYRNESDVELLYSSSDVLETLLNQKAAYARKHGISISIKKVLPENMPIQEADICVIISNLLDNAIEGSIDSKNASVILAIQPAGGYLHIMCRNSVAHDVLRSNPKLETTKSGGTHGLGLKIVRSIVEKYEGMLELNVEDGNFSASLMLKLACRM